MTYREHAHGRQSVSDFCGDACSASFALALAVRASGITAADASRGVALTLAGIATRPRG